MDDDGLSLKEKSIISDLLATQKFYFRAMKKLALFAFIILILTSCEQHSIKEEKQWGDIFKKYGIDSACFELRDHNHEQVKYFNLPRAGEGRKSPASTFKIFLSLVALESNVALDENLVIPWNGVVNQREEWNKDMDMREAFKTSSEPYFKELARRIGKVELQKWIDSVKYGNRRIGDSIDQCWVNDTLLITADEQVGFMKKLYFDKLPFSQRSMRIVKSMMLSEENNDYKLYYKTGTKVYDQNKGYLVWLVGFMERKETQRNAETKLEETNFKPYFFALNFDTQSDSLIDPSVRIRLLKEILSEQQIIHNSK